MGRKQILAALIPAMVYCCAADAQSNWTEAKGIYLGMPSNALKKQGFRCEDFKEKVLFDEKCLPPQDEKYRTFGGEQVTLFEVAVKSNKVFGYSIFTKGNGDGLDHAMKEKYGKPKSAKGNWFRGTFQWHKGGAEFITLIMDRGKNEVSFQIDPTIPTKSEIEARRQKLNRAAKDF